MLSKKGFFSDVEEPVRNLRSEVLFEGLVEEPGRST
jgi:hypothetical protein